VSEADPRELLKLAVEVARRAGELLLRRRPAQLDVDTKTTPTDVVTGMDTASEQLIVEELRAVRPADGILAEEGSEHPGDSGVRWVIDPLDGTVNYLYGLPHWAVSIAAESGGDVVAGAVFDPVKDELYAAATGGGATCNGEPIGCAHRADLSTALVATGFGYAAERRAAQGRVLAGLLPLVRDVRRRGTASLDLCSVARGQVDAYYERGMQPWDIAAGAVIAREAGARVNGLHGVPPTAELTIAAPPELFGPLHNLLADLGADHD
jgi:myo-inositol-1(or 4)-monophosphatase